MTFPNCALCGVVVWCIQMEPDDPPFFVQSTIVFKNEEGAAAYEGWFSDVAASRSAVASMFLLTRTADPLVFVQFEIYRSSAAFEQHQSGEGARGMQGFNELRDSINFDESSIKVAGRVSEPVRISLASMGGVSHAKIAGHILLPGRADADENCIVLTTKFRALDDDKAEAFIRTYEKVTPAMKPFASTFFLCKDPSDAVTFREFMVFRDLTSFEAHYCSRSIIDDLKPSVGATLDMESSDVIAVSNIVSAKAEEVRRALDGLDASYVERVAGYAFVPADVE